ncbi:immunoglobulin-like domain-containing protein [Cohnella massiliensis]|uniref:RCC1 domain-containing protein n=1 Tax=Cohnella massiliensis TaxID=1816691 RepID=UPI001593E5D4|nr:immunoglobulin-like domain-containing protein [Cohnella massiliensis]
MLFIKRRRVVSLILSFVLLFIAAAPYGAGSAHAAQTGMGSRIVKIAAGWSHSLTLQADGTVVAWGDNLYGETDVPSRLAGAAAIAAGWNYSLALKSDGTVVAWGRNNLGQTNVPAGLTGVVAIAAGWNHSLALRADGTVIAWGDNLYGQTDVPAGLTGVVSIAAGGLHSLALKADGTVVAWGNNHDGQTTVPSGLTGVVAIAAGGSHSLALKADGTVIAWGDNSFGQANVPTGLTGVVSIAAGGNHSLALRADGTVVAWGINSDGQANVPAGLFGVATIAAGQFLSLALKADGTVVAWGDKLYGQTRVPAGLAMPVKGNGVAAGGNHSLALKTDGTVVAWGNNSEGQTDVPAGLTGVVSIAAGGLHSLALKADGTVGAWGRNNFGQTTVPSGLTGVVSIAAGGLHSLALKADGTVVAWGNNHDGQATVPPGLTGVAAIAAGGSHSLALKADGTVVAWGSKSYGQTNVPPGLTGVAAIAAGGSHSLALKADGAVVAWGDNSLGQTNVPAGLAGVVSIAAGGSHSLALKADGTVVAWGDNSLGQTNVPAGLNGVVSIAAGGSHSLALRSDGTVVGWGNSDLAAVPGNDSLSGLTLQEGVLEPSFSPSVTAYTYAYLDPSVTSVHITATLADPTGAELYVDNQPQASGDVATVSVWGSSTVIPVRVEPYLKPAQTYTITVLKDAAPPDVQFAANGNASPSQTAESTVTVTDTQSGVDAASLQYAWTQSAAVPTGGWTAFASGDTLRQTSGDGDWYLHVRAQDLAGNVADAVSNAFVLDNTAPELALNGSNPMNIPQGETYTEPGAVATDAIDGPIPASSIAISGTVDTARLGNYPVQYAVTDRAGNTASVIRDVYVYDGDAPAIYLNGASPMTVEVNSIFTDPGATAQDVQDGDISASITVTGTVDTTTLGAYTLSYNVSDAAGNAAATVMRTVYVRDMQPPALTLLGDPVMSVPVGAAFADPGAQATDAYYGDVSDRIVVTGTVDTSQAGEYTLRYNVTDPSGNAAAEVTRTVKVTQETGNSTYITFRPFIDKNGIIFDPSAIDTTKPSVTLEVTPKDNTAYVSIPASILAGWEEKNAAFFIEIKTPYGSYQVPADLASLIPGLTDLLAANYLKPEDISFKITLTDKSGDKDIQAALASRLPKGKVLGTIVDFHMDIINNRTGKAIGTADQFGKALTRVLPMPKDITGMPEQWGAFRYNETTKKFEFVPAQAVKIADVWYAIIRSYSNSAYIVAQNTVSFTDVQKHWGEPYIQLAAAKGLVEGVGGGQYGPDKTVTRAEFTAMLVRALGRGASAGSTAPYDDVKQSAWYFDAVATAKDLGLLDFASGTRFQPDQPLTREEMASMLAAVIALEKLPIPKENVNLNGYKDMGNVDAAYLEDVRLMVKLHIMTGTSEDAFSPKGVTTRAQAAAVLIRTLQALGMIDG